MLLVVRWERLFGDLSALADDHDKMDRDALAAEVRDEHWAQASWLDVLATAQSISVAGAGELSGRVGAVGTHMIHLQADACDHLLSIACVRSVGYGASPAGAVDQENMPTCRHRHVLRQWARDGGTVQVTDREGSQQAGELTRVGKDFVMLAAPARTFAVPVEGVSVFTRFR